MDITVIKMGFKMVSKDPDTFAEMFYGHVLENEPRLGHVFRNTDLRLQKAELIKGLLIINTLLECEKDLTNYLFDLGLRHTCYEVELGDYKAIEDGLIYAIKFIHGNEWTGEIELTWKNFFKNILNKMKSGATKNTVKAS